MGAGKLLEVAAEEMGIPLAEAIEWLVAKKDAAAQDEAAARILAAEALEAGIAKLKALAEGEQRVSSESETIQGNGSSTSYRADDLAAAKALVDTALKLRRGFGRPQSAESAGSQKDLFDTPPSNWDFKPRG